MHAQTPILRIWQDTYATYHDTRLTWAKGLSKSIDLNKGKKNNTAALQTTKCTHVITKKVVEEGMYSIAPKVILTASHLSSHLQCIYVYQKYFVSIYLYMYVCIFTITQSFSIDPVKTRELLPVGHFNIRHGRHAVTNSAFYCWAKRYTWKMLELPSFFSIKCYKYVRIFIHVYMHTSIGLCITRVLPNVWESPIQDINVVDVTYVEQNVYASYVQ